MDIGEISGSNAPTPRVRSKKQKEEKSAAAAIKVDRAEVSSKAQSMYEAEHTKRLEDIQKKIADGFYARREVMERVVDELLKQLT